MITQEQQDNILQVLNDAINLDPRAIHALIVNRVPINEALESHPLITCQTNPIVGGCDIGFLGIVNGIMGALGLPIIEVAIGKNEFGPFRFQVPKGSV